jgi:hypothetical protein
MVLRLERVYHRLSAERRFCYCAGHLYKGDAWVCDILEPYDWENGLHPADPMWGRAIPLGDYPIRVDYPSKKFGMVPMVLNVPGRTGILFHPGNFPTDTRGCLLPGKWMGFSSVLRSREYFGILRRILADARAVAEPIILSVEKVY